MRVICSLLVLFICVSCASRDRVVDPSLLLANDYRLFQETPYWDLAKAVQDERIDDIKRLVLADTSSLFYQEKRFGRTLLMLSIVNQQYKSCDALLELGADFTIRDSADGKSAIFFAAEINNEMGSNDDFLKLLLGKGANPNDTTISNKSNRSSQMSVLIAACRCVNQLNSPLSKVELLVNSGAQINYQTSFGETALSAAITSKNLDVALFLLKNGADPRTIIFVRDGKSLFIEDVLRELLFPIGSKQYLQKMEIVEWLKGKGIDYYAVPVPEIAITKAKKMYPDDWEEYLKKY